MKIVLPIAPLLEELFPEVENHKDLSQDDLEYIEEVYSFGSINPVVEVVDNYLIIKIDEEVIKEESQKYEKVVRLCENERFNEALVNLNQLIEENPLVADYHRIKGQVLSEQGSQKQAIDSLIEAVRLDPENSSALTMLGNIYSKYENDIDTAIKFYEGVLELNPDDHLALNNVGGNLAKAGRTKEAKQYFDRAYEVNPEYPNTIYGQALLASRTGDNKDAFDKAIESLQYLNKNKNRELFKQAFQLAQDSAIEVIKSTNASTSIDTFIERLEDRSGKPIEVTSSSNISTAAKLEVAEVHGRDKHLLKFKPNRIAVEHLILHELFHLDLILIARAENKNKHFTTDNNCRQEFENDHLPQIKKKLQQTGLPEAKVRGFVDNLFHGLNSQIYNTPIDLFIEQRIYNRFADLRPYQFMSLLKLTEEYIKSSTDNQVRDLVTDKIHRTNKILSLVNTLQFEALYKVDLTKQFKPRNKDLKQAQEFYEEWTLYKDDHKPGLEYELIESWSNKLGISEYFNLVDEENTRSSDVVENTLNDIESDPLSLDNQENIGEESFSNEGSSAGEMAATMYIVDALNYFEDKSVDEIKKIGFEIGMLGRSGIETDNPDKQYSLKSIPGKKFSGRHLLAYMYTAFQEFEPDLDTGIDFEEEYKRAKELHKKGL